MDIGRGWSSRYDSAVNCRTCEEWATGQCVERWGEVVSGGWSEAATTAHVNAEGLDPQGPSPFGRESPHEYCPL